MINVLVVVDVQNDFCEGGSLAVEGGAAVAKRINDSINWSNYDLIIATQDWHQFGSDNGGHISNDPDFVDSWPAHCIAHTDGAEIHPNLTLPDRTRYFTKGFGEPAYSGFEASDDVYGELLHEFLTYNGATPSENITLDVVGIATDYCVKATALDGASKGYNVNVLLDFCAGITPESTRAAIAEMRDAGVRFP